MRSVNALLTFLLTYLLYKTNMGRRHFQRTIKQKDRIDRIASVRFETGMINYTHNDLLFLGNVGYGTRTAVVRNVDTSGRVRPGDGAHSIRIQPVRARHRDADPRVGRQ